MSAPPVTEYGGGIMLLPCRRKDLRALFIDEPETPDTRPVAGLLDGVSWVRTERPPMPERGFGLDSSADGSAMTALSDAALAKVTDLKKLPLVEVSWEDATSCQAWMTVKEAREDDGPVPCLTVGRLVRNSKKSVDVVQTIAGHGKVAAVWSIPKGWVKRVRRLRDYSPQESEAAAVTPEQRAVIRPRAVELCFAAGHKWVPCHDCELTAAVAAEREACAQTVASLNSDDDYPVCCAAANAQAVAAIRARQ